MSALHKPILRAPYQSTVVHGENALILRRECRCVGFLRLRSCFASRSGYFAQDDISAEALRQPKSTAAGEGARATRNRVISLGLSGAAKSRAPSKQHQNPERSADVESRPFAQNARSGLPRGHKSKSKAAGEGARATQALAAFFTSSKWVNLDEKGRRCRRPLLWCPKMVPEDSARN